MNVPIVYHPDYFSDIGDHVFPTKKFRLIYDGLKEQFEDFESFVHRPTPASREQILRVHTPEYFGDLCSHRHTFRTIPSELPVSKEIVDAYILMAGGSCLAAKLAVEHGCASNLGGGFHHAFADKAEGFCYINDIAVAVRTIQSEFHGHGKIERVAVIDTDLHQGNGTAHIFRNDPEVFTFSIHQEHNYPIKEKSDLDIGLDDGTGDGVYLAQLEKSLETIFSEFNPQSTIYVGGVDPYEQDQLGSLKITKAGMKKRDLMVFRYCRENKVPVATVLAGGYARDIRDTVEMHMNTYLALRSTFN
jgi:acetoin utilization deacetylase AcuC-like enzyme